MKNGFNLYLNKKEKELLAQKALAFNLSQSAFLREIINNFDYLKDVIFFIDTYLNIKYVSSEYFINKLRNFIHRPMGKYQGDVSTKRKIIGKIYSNLDYQDNITDNMLNEVTEYQLSSNYILSGETDLDIHFQKIN